MPTDVPSQGRRIFIYDNREFPDPDPEMSVEQVRESLADHFGDLVNATVKESRRGIDTIYEFERKVGTKGAGVKGISGEKP